MTAPPPALPVNLALAALALLLQTIHVVFHAVEARSVEEGRAFPLFFPHVIRPVAPEWFAGVVFVRLF